MAHWVDMFGNKVKHISLAPMTNTVCKAIRRFSLQERGIGIQDGWEPFSLWNMLYNYLRQKMSENARNFWEEFLDQGNFVIKSQPRNFDKYQAQAEHYRRMRGREIHTVIIDEVSHESVR